MDARMMGQGMRRRMGAPSSHLGMVEPTQDNPQAVSEHGFATPGPGNPLDALVGHFASNQGWMDAQHLQRAVKAVDRDFGKGAGKAAHKELVTRGAVTKQRARATHYSLNG